MYLIVLFLPLIAALILLSYGFKLGREGSILFVSIVAALNCFVVLFIFYEVAFCESLCFFSFMSWFDVDCCLNFLGCFFDSLTVIMLVAVTFISFIVHIYSIGYMGDDPHLIRFLAYLSLFTFFMLFLVVSSNLVQLFIGWEGVGLCSYLLINFWHTRLQANKAAIKAVVINRIGDLGIILAIISFYFFIKSVNFSVIFSMSFFMLFQVQVGSWLSISGVEVLTLFLFLGAVGKSAQLGLHTWLPDAMEGPTPVSALIHAATMVTAGVFIVIRFSPIFEIAPFTLVIVTFCGALTALFGATTALFQNDIKKIVAYSTCSQLGYMFLICGLSHYNVGVFHLFTHAFFKALLFLGAGAIIHAVGDEQDIRRLGGLRRLLPFSYAVFLIGSLSLVGFPFLAGFYSKDAILEIAFMRYSVIGHFSFIIGVLSAFFTASYSIKLLYFVFFSQTNAFLQTIRQVQEVNYYIFFSLVCLVFGSIFFGFFFSDMLIGLGTSFWQNSIFIFSEYSIFHDYEFLIIFLKSFPLIIVCFGLIGGFYFCEFLNFNFFFKNFFKFRMFYVFFNRKWFFDKLQNELISQSFLDICLSYFYVHFDKGFLEKFGPRGIQDNVIHLSFILQQSFIGRTFNFYFFLFVLGFLLLGSLVFSYQFFLIVLILICFFFFYSS